MSRSFKGLTWDHPRGKDALLAAAARIDPDRDGFSLDWDLQPLEGFESAPIADLCARYDVVVMDHPHLGEALTHNCLTPWDDLLPAHRLQALASATMGASLKSYQMQGRLWALPLDAATQVMARRADLVPDCPDDWAAVLKMSRQTGKVAVSWAGPHALMSFFSLCVANGDQPGGPDLVRDDTAIAALEILRELLSHAPAGTQRLNPIGLLDAMTSGDEIGLCPLVYGYVTYAAAGRPRRVDFSDAPRGAAGRGSVLGGTGIAMSRRARPVIGLIEHLDWLMSHQAQVSFLPDHSGQPSLRAAWADDGVNQRWGGFYRQTAQTLETAWVRPRFDGYVGFQVRGAEILQEAMAQNRQPRSMLARLRDAWRAASNGAAG